MDPISLIITFAREILNLGGKVFNTVRKKITYQKPVISHYKFFNGSQYLVRNNTQEEKQFLNKLDRAKREADNSLINKTGTSKNTVRLRDINHYVFKIYRDFWLIQQEWYKNRGRYFQGIKTMPSVPDCKQDHKVDIPYNLNDQTDDWEDIGYLDTSAPIQIECHVYDGPSGQGFVLFMRVKIDRDVWGNRLHYGTEDYRNLNNLLWVKENG